MLTTVIIPERILQFFDQIPKNSNKGNDNNNIGNQQNVQISPNSTATNVSQMKNLKHTSGVQDRK